MTPEKPARESLVQFDLRGLLFVIVVPAVSLGILGPQLRNWETRHLLNLAGCMALSALPWAAVACVTIWVRSRAERAAGRLLLRIKSTPARRLAFCSGWGSGLVFWFVIVIWFVDTLQSATGWGGFLFLFPPCVYLTMACTNLWWGPEFQGLEFRQRGLVMSIAYHPWESVTGYKWGPRCPEKLTLQIRRARFEFTVLPEQMPAVNELLAEHVPTEQPAHEG